MYGKSFGSHTFPAIGYQYCLVPPHAKNPEVYRCDSQNVKALRTRTVCVI
jgi:hypothetical protein